MQTNILLVEKENALSDPKIYSEVKKVISDDWKMAKTFNEFFENIAPSLKILPKEITKSDVGNDIEPTSNYINNLTDHPSIRVIKSRKKEEQTFILIMFLMKKFLTKLGKYKLRQQYSKMIFQKKF